MAEQERKTFKWGDREYLLDDLLKLHAEQENNYYNFARDRGQYDETALSGLRQAISDRINAVKSGQAFDADGVLGTDTVDNTTIQTQKKGLFKKAKYVDQDNTEWAKYYLNKLVGQLKPYEKGTTADKGAWDITKHGLSAYLTGQGLNARDIFEKYDLRDKDNPEAARSFTQRREILKKHLAGYNNWLKGKGFDFSKNDNEWDDTFGTDLDKFVTDYDNLDNNALATQLRRFGAGDDYTTAFTSDRWDLSKSSDQLAEEEKLAAQQKKAKEEKEKYQQYIKDTHGAFKALEDNNFGGTFFTSSGDGLFDMSDSEYETWLNTHTNDKDAYMRNLQESYYKNPFDTKVAGEYLPLAERFGALKDVTIGGRAYKYDPRTIDRTKNRFVAFDPESGEIRHAFIGDIEAEKEALRRKWRIDNGYEDEAAQYFEEGGVISMQTGGGFNLAQSVNRDLEERNKKRAKETGNTEKVQAARDRVVSNGDDSFVSEQDSIASPNAGFSGAEVARLVSIGADITSMFLDPVTGTAVGLGSTLTNFGADIADDGFQWEDVKNLGINVGFDLLGAIPLFGDAVGTGSKITRNLVKWAPRVMAGLAAYQGVSNFDGMMDSWGKFTSGDKDQKLTVQDWRNIAQSIGLVTGATRAIKNKVAQNQMKNKAKVDGVVGVNVRDKNTGEIKQLLVDGKTAETIRNHKGDAKKIQQTLSELEGYKDKFGENGTWEINTKSGGLQKPFGRTENADGSKSWELRGFRKDGRADVNDVYDFSQVPQGYGASAGYKIPGVSDYLNNLHQSWVSKLSGNPTQINARGVMTSAEIDAQHQQLLKDQGVDAQIEKLTQAMDARNKSQEITKDKLTKAQEALGLNQDRVKGLASEADLQANKTAYETQLRSLPDDLTLRNAEQAIAHNQSILDRNKTRRAELSASRKEKIQQSVEGFDNKIAKKQDKIKKLQKRLKSLNKIKNPTPEQIREKRSLIGHIQGQQRAISGIEAKKGQIADKITKQYTKEYARLAAENKTAKGSIATAQPIANQRQSLMDYRAKLKGVENDLATYTDVNTKNTSIQQRINTLQGRLSAHDPATTHTKAYQDLEALLNNLRTSHQQIGGRQLDWDMNTILAKYNVQNAFKEGGSINRNKINKFLNYAKG